MMRSIKISKEEKMKLTAFAVAISMLAFSSCGKDSKKDDEQPRPGSGAGSNQTAGGELDGRLIGNWLMFEATFGADMKLRVEMEVALSKVSQKGLTIVQGKTTCEAVAATEKVKYSKTEVTLEEDVEKKVGTESGSCEASLEKGTFGYRLLSDSEAEFKHGEDVIVAKKIN